MATGCGDDASGEPDTDGLVTTNPTAGGTSGSGGEETGEPTPGEEDEGALASDIGLLRVEVNQGSAIAVVDGGALVEENDHVELVPGRPGVLRVYWETQSGFSPRDIEARVLLVDAGGGRTLLRQTRTVDGLSLIHI